jgi:D-xylose transport system substrate-binding protein
MTPSLRPLALAALTVLVTACGNPSNQATPAGGASGPASAGAPRGAAPSMKIGLLLDDLHERWHRDRDLFVEVATDMGVETLVEVADGDQDRQNAQAQKLLDAGVKALVVVAHDTERAATIVEQAVARGVPVVSYDRLIRNADVDLYIGFDVTKIGEMQAQYLLSRAPKGNYLLIGGAPSDGNAKLLREGQLNVLGPAVKSGAIRIVGDGWAENWRADAAATLTEGALAKAKNKVVAVVASNDVTAGGAIGVLDAHGLAGRVPVSGQDAELDAARRIVAGTQAMTVYKSLRTLTRLAARNAVALAKGEKIDSSTTVNNGKREVPAMIFDAIPVDKDNLDGVLIADGFLTRDEVYGGTK